MLFGRVAARIGPVQSNLSSSRLYNLVHVQILSFRSREEEDKGIKSAPVKKLPQANLTNSVSKKYQDINMEDFLQTAAQFANDHWLTLSIGFLLVLFYRYVSMIFYNPMRYINFSLIFSQCILSTTLRWHQCASL